MEKRQWWFNDCAYRERKEHWAKHLEIGIEQEEDNFKLWL
jgi:hypothetical protein